MIAYRGEGLVSADGCSVRHHYAEVQALCDALGFAAQQLQAEQLVLQQQAEHAAASAGSDGMEAVSDYLALATQHGERANYLYGLFQGYRGLLRALEGNVGELEPLEQEMLDRIDWSVRPPRFLIPGIDFQGKPQRQPGELALEAAQDLPGESRHEDGGK